MPSLIRQLISQTSYMADGFTTVWNFSFPYLDFSHVKAQYITAAGLVINAIPAYVGPSQVSIVPAVPNGAVLTIHRDTPKSAPLVDFIDRVNLTEAALDYNAKQDIYAAAEAYDWAQVALSDGPVDYVPVAVTGNTQKNVLINGNMIVAQRPNTSLATVGYGAVDRWIVGLFDLAGFSTGESERTVTTDPSWQYPRLNRLGNITCTAGRPAWIQRIETGNALPLAGKVSTLSGKIVQDTSVARTFRASVFGSVSVPYDTRLFYVDVMVPPNTVTPFSLTGVVDYASAGMGLSVAIELLTPAALTANNFYLGDCQLEVGSVATTLEARPSGLEIVLCQRYYERVTAMLETYVVGAVNTAGSRVGFAVPKRTVPTMTQITNNVGLTQTNVTASTSSYIPQTDGVFVYRQSVAAGTVRFGELLAASAEL